MSSSSAIRLSVTLLILGTLTASSGCVTTAQNFALSVTGADYFSADELDLTHVLEPPSAVDAAGTKAEFAELARVQKERSVSDCVTAQADTVIDPSQFYAALGLSGDAKAASDLAKLRAMLSRTHLLEAVIVDRAKRFYNRPRPYALNSELRPCIDRPSDASYPSGHAAWAFMTATLLSDMIPMRRGAIFERASQFARSRVIGGVHFPSDVEAGRIAGEAIARKLLASREFRAEQRKVQDELRSALENL